MSAITHIKAPVIAEAQLDVHKASEADAATRAQQSKLKANAPADSSRAEVSDVAIARNNVASYAEATEKLQQEATWSRDHARSSDPTSVIAQSVGAPPGLYTVQVDKLATHQTSVSAPVPDRHANLALNTLHIQVGTWSSSPNAFTSNPIWPRSSIVVGPGDTSLQNIRDKINSAAVGVMATVISDGTGSRLVLSSRQTGSVNGFQVTTDSAEDVLKLQHQPAQDAQASVNGQKIRSASNTVEQAAPGLNLQFQKVTAQPVSITVGPNTPDISQTVKQFANSFNELRRTNTDLSTAVKSAPAQLKRELQNSGISWSSKGDMNVDTEALEKVAQGKDLDRFSERMRELTQHLNTNAKVSMNWQESSTDSPFIAQYVSLENGGV